MKLKCDTCIHAKDPNDYYCNTCSEGINFEDGEKISEIGLRQFSADICDIFEDLLAEHNITIPDPDRTGEEDEARLYGTTYTNVEDKITRILSVLAWVVKLNPEAEIDPLKY